MEALAIILTTLGAAIGITLTIKNIRMSNSLLGSFFRRSFSFAIIGSIFLFLAFATEALGLLGFNYFDVLELVHHILFFVSSIAFFSVAVVFPKEAESKLSGKE